jgi:hypothetical protein
VGALGVNAVIIHPVRLAAWAAPRRACVAPVSSSIHAVRVFGAKGATASCSSIQQARHMLYTLLLNPAISPSIIALSPFIITQKRRKSLKVERKKEELFVPIVP